MVAAQSGTGEPTRMGNTKRQGVCVVRLFGVPGEAQRRMSAPGWITNQSGHSYSTSAAKAVASEWRLGSAAPLENRTPSASSSSCWPRVSFGSVHDTPGRGVPSAPSTRCGLGYAGQCWMCWPSGCAAVPISAASSP